MTRTRRDPRAQREATRIAGTGRPRFSRAAVGRSGALGVSGAEMGASDGRPRRDLREERRRLLVPGTARPRLDRLHYQGTSSVGSVAMVPAAEIGERLHIIDVPAYLVAVVPDAPGGRLSAHDRQLLGAARLLALDGGAVVVLAETEIDDLGRAGADRVAIIPSTGGYDPDARASVTASALDAMNIRHALFGETADGGDLARRVAAQLGEELFSGAESLTAKLVTRPARGRRVEQRRTPPRLISLIADAVAPHGGEIHEARPVELLPTGMVETQSAILSSEIIPADPSGIALSEAEFVVSAGNGVTDIDTFLKVAKALKATPGASRMLCDAGLMPRAAQVGASGTVLDATCYLALGIAGAPQHLQGIAACEHVVAVNTDLHAAMVERAGLAIIADAQAVMPALIAALDEERLS